MVRNIAKLTRLASTAVLFGLVTVWGTVDFGPAYAQQRVEQKVTVDGRSRRYIAHLPPSYLQKAPLPVVLAFHGAFSKPETFEEGAALHKAKGAENFIIVYPAGFRRFWNLGVCCGAAKRRNIDDIKFVRTILNDLDSFVRIDRRRVYATGFSNGGMFSYYLACTMSEEIAAIAPAGAAMQQPSASDCQPTRPVPVLHLHGMADKWAPYGGGKSEFKHVAVQPPVEQGIDFWRRFNGCRAQSTDGILGSDASCIVYSGCDRGAKVELCRVPGLGHHWPGSVPTPVLKRLVRKLGPLGPPVRASETVLKFFSANALP